MLISTYLHGHLLLIHRINGGSCEQIDSVTLQTLSEHGLLRYRGKLVDLIRLEMEQLSSGTAPSHINNTFIGHMIRIWSQKRRYGVHQIRRLLRLMRRIQVAFTMSLL